MKILVTGGAGFLGSNLVVKAIEAGHDVIAIDNLSRLGSVDNLAWLKKIKGFSFQHCDVRSEDSVRACIKMFKPDFVAHLAGQVAMTTSIESPSLDFSVNAIGTLNLLEAVRTYSPRTKVVYSSTNKVYGNLEHLSISEGETRYYCADYPRGFDESLNLCFESPYGCSKGAADQYVLDYQRCYGVQGIVFRHSSIYGGRQYSTYDQGWVGWFCLQAVQSSLGCGKPFTVSGSGKQVRDLLHVSDAADLYLKAAVTDESAWGAAYNIGGGMSNSLSLLELLASLEREVNTSLRFDRIPSRQSDQRFFVANTAKATERFGWSPQIDWRSGLRDALRWSIKLEAGS